MKAHVSPAKKEIVKKLIKRLEEEKIVGVVNMQDLPAAQLQNIRRSLHGKINLFMTKKRLMRIAIEKVKAKKPGIEKLEENFDGMPALLFTKENPFSLYKTLKKSKSPAPAKAGQKAPKDIEIKAGPTQFAPGPVISELSQLGLKPGVENGKVAIKEDKIVAQEGDVISAPLASMLMRLGINPMEIGLNLVAVYEEGTIYSRKVLDVDEEQLVADMGRMATEAFNLAMEIGFPAKEVLEALVGKLHNEAKSLAIETGFITKETAGDVLAKAQAQAQSLKSEANL